MAITGAWSQRIAVQSGALKWGTGWNPVHAIRDNQGRNIAPGGTPYMIDHSVVDPYAPDDYGYCDEDTTSTLYGYGTSSGTADRPPVGTSDNRSDVTPGFPSYGPKPAGIPGGTVIRAERHGAYHGIHAKQSPYETVDEGWLNKPVGVLESSVTAADSQVFVQTSDVQMAKNRSGSQMSAGRADEHSALVPGIRWTMGQRVKTWSGELRHYDMTPREQNTVIRRWWSRNAGTGNPTWMASNEMYVSQPILRNPPPDPYSGPDEGDTAAYLSDAHGYTGEDVIPYA